MVATLLLSTRYRSGPVLLGVSAAFAVQCVIAAAFGGLLALLPDRVTAVLACLMFGAGAVLLLRNGADAGLGLTARAEHRTWWGVAALSFGVLFTAEWGDASQFAIAALTARYSAPLSVGLGGWLALITIATLAVLVGRSFAARLPTKWLQRIAGAMFAGFAIVAGVAAVLG